jgi:TonB family protein
VPLFPPAALEKGVKAEIKLLVEVDEKGQVSGASVLLPQTSTGLGFEEAAVTAASELTFEPAEMEGKPVAVQIVYTFKFVPPKPETSTIPRPADPPPAAPPPAPTLPPVKNFEGILRERGTRLPLAATLVTVYREDGPKPIGFECTSDQEGRFTFFDLTPGPWHVRIEPPGYAPFQTTEEIRQRELVKANYYIERSSYNPFDVVVTSRRPRKEVTRVIIEREVIEKAPGAMGDPLIALQNFAGVGRVTYSDNIIVRGSSPRDTKVFVDGIDIPIAYHFGGLRSVVPTGIIDSLEFYPGNFSAYYGRATGGAIDVTLKKPLAKRWTGYADINLLDSGFFLEVPVTSKLVLMAGARRSYMDVFINKIFPDSVPFTMTKLPVYYDYQLSANYRPTPAHDLRLFLFGSDDSMTMVFKNSANLGSELNGNRISEGVRFQRAFVSYRYVPGEHFENSLRISLGRDRADEIFAQFVQHLYKDSIQLRDTARLRLGEMLTLVGGMDGILEHWTGYVHMPMPEREGREVEDLDLTRTYEATADENHWLPSAFAMAELTPASGLMLIPALRFDYFSKIKDATFEPRFTARYTLKDELSVKGGVGLYYQEPSIDESNEGFGNPLLKAERAIHYSAGVEAKGWAGLSLDLTGFYKDLSNLVSPTTKTRDENGLKVPLRYDNQGVGRVIGMELTLRRDPVHRLSGWVAYTLSRSERRDSGATKDRLFQYDQTHILTAVGMWRFGRNWQLSSRFRLISGNPATPVTGAVLKLNTGTYKPIYGDQYSDRNPMFVQWDVRIDKTWVFDRFLLDLYLDVQNVTNRTNIEAPDYNYDYTHRKTEKGLSLYPILGLRVEL